MDEVMTPIRHKSRREVKRAAKVGDSTLDSLYNTKVSKRNKTSINSYITLTLAK